jgi:hypothetical protein
MTAVTPWKLTNSAAGAAEVHIFLTWVYGRNRVALLPD